MRIVDSVRNFREKRYRAREVHGFSGNGVAETFPPSTNFMVKKCRPPSKPTSYMGTMLGCSNRAAALGLHFESLHLRSGREVTGNDHLQCNRAVELRISRTIHNAHAAAGNFNERLVVAKVEWGDGRNGTRFASAGCRPERAAEGNASKGLAVHRLSEHARTRGRSKEPG